MSKIGLKLLGVGLLCLGVFYAGSALVVPAKAYLSVHLIDAAWERALEGEGDLRPWPWMDSVPVAKVSIPSQNQSHVVMSGVSGSTLAFAPGWHEGSDAPGHDGVSVISAHKDTHFSYLDKLQQGDDIIMQAQDGAVKVYEVEGFRVLQSPEIHIHQSEEANYLVLSTCYPFNNWDVGGQMRYIVIAKEIAVKANARYAGL